MKRLIHCFLILTLAGAATAGEVRVSISGGYEEIDGFSRDQLDYFSLSGLAEILGGQVSWIIPGQQLEYADQSFKFVFLLDAAMLLLDDSTYNMTYPALLKDGQLMLPAATFLPLLDRVTGQKVIWEPERKTVRIDSEYFNVTDLSVQSKENGLLIDIYVTEPLSYEIFVTEGNWLNVSIRDARINRNQVLARKDSRYMYRLKVHQIENNQGQISLRLKRAASKWTHKIAYNPTRIQIAVKDVNFEMDSNGSRPDLGPDNKIDVIVIDAGHGGDDYGAVGPGGTREKDVTLSIAKRLAKKIRKDKLFKVIMTRDRDHTVSLEKRAKIANDAGGDMFISIHANASPKRHVRGWNVFFLAPALNDTARSVEQLENSYFLRETYDEAADNPDDFDPVLSILNEMIMTEFQAESYDLAQMCDREFRKRLETKARGIDQAGFFVLNKVFTPSVLIESAFISNKNEEKLLKSKKYQENLATALYDAIKRFKAKFEGN